MADGIDLQAVQIHNSHDVRSWPATSTITRLEFRSTGVHVEHSKNKGAGAWPNFRPAGWDGDLQYTLWIFLNIGGQWHGSGCIQFWHDCDQNGGPPDEFAKNWYYDPARWAPMTGHQPTVGERVGFMVSAGDARGLGLHPVDERSNIVAMPFPRSGDVYVGQVVPVEPPPPPPPVNPPPPVDPVDPVDPGPSLEPRLAALEAKVDAALAALEAVSSITGWEGTVRAKIFGQAITAPVLVDKPRHG